MKKSGRLVITLALIGILFAGETTAQAAPQPRTPADLPLQTSVFADSLAQDTWAYLHSDWATDNHLPWSWRSSSLSGGDYANPAEIGFYALSWIAAYDMAQPWSPDWAATEKEVRAILDQLIAWQTGSQTYQPYGPNAYHQSVFYQWYWINSSPPVVGSNSGDNHLVPSVDNAWLAASLITIREYAEANRHSSIAQKADAILDKMDFTLWYHYDTHRFSWGDVENPQGGTQADYYSNENRIINFVARALGQLSEAEFRNSLLALNSPAGSYNGISVESVAWDGSYFTYAGPAVFIREMDTPYGWNTIIPATRAQIKYAQDQGYAAWGLSDSYDIGSGGYLQQGSLPVVMAGIPEDRAGLVTPHAGALALMTPLAPGAIENLQVLASISTCYDPSYGFRDAIMVKPGADYGNCSSRFSALAQEWIFLSITNFNKEFVWKYFYRDEGVTAAHAAMYAPAWSLVWADEFNGSGPVDASKWICDTGTQYTNPNGPANWGTGEVQSYTCDLTNVSQANGLLTIRALHTGSDPLTYWTSGRIETVRADFQPPSNSVMAVEARIQLPDITSSNGLGYWPAFWMLGSAYRGNYWNWPGIGEIDVMENVNGLNQWWGTLHCGTTPGGPCNETNGLGGSMSGFSPNLQSTFHTFRMELDRSKSPQEIRWYVDGVPTSTLQSDQVDATTWNNATNHGFFILLNLAMGGGFPNGVAGGTTPTAATISGGSLLVDYVRVYYLDVPVVHSILRASSNPAFSASVSYAVTFSESVTGVDTSDFLLTGIADASVINVSGSGMNYMVLVDTGSTDGILRLDVVDNNTIKNTAGNALGGTSSADGNFNSGEVYTVKKNSTFGDTPSSHWAWQYIERLYSAAITGGCSTSPLSYCPESEVTRAQMAVFLEKGVHYPISYSPSNVSSTFNDTTGHWAEDWIEALKNDGITSGCAIGLYCPDSSVTRAQMAVFLLKAKHGSSYTPPNVTTTFGDIAGHWAEDWIEQLAAEGITSGCASGLYCPESPVTRAQMAVFLVKAFGLP